MESERMDFNPNIAYLAAARSGSFGSTAGRNSSMALGQQEPAEGH
jgi:hypothetical protein